MRAQLKNLGDKRAEFAIGLNVGRKVHADNTAKLITVNSSMRLKILHYRMYRNANGPLTRARIQKRVYLKLSA